MSQFASRAGEKLQFALDNFKISVKGSVCADFGSSTGGFVDCLLQNGAEKVYAAEKGYGVLDWKLRNNPKVAVLERANAMHVELPEKVDFISIDVSWTKQKNIIPNALKNLKDTGLVLSLIKPHYEANKKDLRKGKLVDEKVNVVLEKVTKDIEKAGGKVKKTIESPITGSKGRNREFFALTIKGEERA